MALARSLSVAVVRPTLVALASPSLRSIRFISSLSHSSRRIDDF